MNHKTGKRKQKNRYRQRLKQKKGTIVLILVLLATIIWVLIATSEPKYDGVKAWEDAYNSVDPKRVQKMVDIINNPKWNNPILEEKTEPKYNLDITITHKWE